VTDLWSAKTRIDSVHFQAGCRRRWLNLALVFCLFCAVVHLFWLVNVCFCCARFSFCIPSREIGLWNVSKMTYFLSSRSQNLNLINLCYMYRLQFMAWRKAFQIGQSYLKWQEGSLMVTTAHPILQLQSSTPLSYRLTSHHPVFAIFLCVTFCSCEQCILWL